MDRSDSERLARLELEVAVLRAELVKLRSAIQAEQASEKTERVAAAARAAQAPLIERAAAPSRSSSAYTPPPPRPDIPPAREMKPTASKIADDDEKASFEDYVGRYGTLAVATILVLVGTGIFLSWAIKHGLLGPTARVVLGFIGAAALAFGGWRLRIKGTREFGNVLIALALAVTHLVCWSAGPYLHVMPSVAALAIAAICSVVLVEFALRHDEETLCAVGFGGAALAPFVTNDGGRNVVALAAYGSVVIVLGIAALGARTWKVARQVVVLAFILYLLSVSLGVSNNVPLQAVAERLGVLFPLAVLVGVTFFAHEAHRRDAIRVVSIGAIAGGFMRASNGADMIALAVIITTALLAVGMLEMTAPRREAPLASDGDGRVATDHDQKSHPVIDAGLIPIAFFGTALLATSGPGSAIAAGLAVVWFALAVVATYRSRAEREAEPYAATASVAALSIVPLATSEGPVWSAVGMGVTGVVLAVLMDKIPRRAFGVGAIFAFVLATAWAVLQLEARIDYSYTPFLTKQTIAGAAAALSCIIGAGLLSTATLEARDANDEWMFEKAPWALSLLSPFLWIRAELAGAISLMFATVALIIYYAATGVVAIGYGRIRRIRSLRFAGLGLTLLAAGKVLNEALSVPNVAVQVGLFFAVSAFLIGVAYWYRKGAPDPVA